MVMRSRRRKPLLDERSVVTTLGNPSTGTSVQQKQCVVSGAFSMLRIGFGLHLFRPQLYKLWVCMY
jgi:hypothetical protein